MVRSPSVRWIGANVEMREEVGAENFFVFGMTTEEVAEVRRQGYDPMSFYHGNAELKLALDMISSGYFSPDRACPLSGVTNALLHLGDHYLLLADYASYIECQDKGKQPVPRPAGVDASRHSQCCRHGKILQRSHHTWNMRNASGMLHR